MVVTEQSRVPTWSASAPGRGWPGAALFAGINATLAAVGHHLASEEPVAWVRLASVAAGVFIVSVPVTRRARGPAGTVSATLLAQAVLHRGIALPGPHATHAPMSHSAHHAPWLMFAAHVAAALTVASLLHWADHRLRGLSVVLVRWALATAAALSRAARSLPGCSLRAPLRVAYSPVAAPRCPAAVAQLVHVVVRRGPPGVGPSGVPDLSVARQPAFLRRARTEMRIAS
ncbi:hypothetical protein [Streptomyces sp. NBC_00239]|uniref:hypothetical protein n=1 Tax=Streptomyces sp. NBC_00239 TaxID=2903640 RepID=UPI002E2ADB51|nr:hypothetical protein [Streptomyces sp. NBC_00239]